MTYRPVDLQVSVPRVQETAIQQSQYQTRLAAEAQNQERASIQHTEAERQRAGEVEQKGNAHISDDRPGNGGDSGGSRTKKQHAKPGEGKQGESAHPFKGQYVDFSL